MADFILCNVCKCPGAYHESSEVNEVPSNVRKFQGEKFTVWRCNSCRSLHSKEEVDLDYYYKNYPVGVHRLDFWARVAYRNHLKRLKREGLRPDQAILDYGCGPGLLMSFLQEKGYRMAVGYDPYVASFSDSTALDGSYDFVISQDVVEHADDPRQLMVKLGGLLRPNGVLCIGTPNADNIDIRQPTAYAASLHQPYHRHILSERALVELGKEAGLTVGTVYHTWYYNTLVPTVNHRFLSSYIRRAGNFYDAAFESPRIGMVIASPMLLSQALLGYFFPPRSEMMIFFHR